MNPAKHSLPWTQFQRTFDALWRHRIMPGRYHPMGLTRTVGDVLRGRA